MEDGRPVAMGQWRAWEAAAGNEIQAALIPIMGGFLDVSNEMWGPDERSVSPVEGHENIRLAGQLTIL